MVEKDGTNTKMAMTAVKGGQATIEQKTPDEPSGNVSYSSTVVQQHSVIEQMAKSVAAATFKEKPVIGHSSKLGGIGKVIKQQKVKHFAEGR